jgi:hypothetical protein
VNERIRQLAEEIYGSAHHDDFRFAELIVQECLDVGSQWADGLIDPKHYDFVNKRIKKYFGVDV